MGVLDALKITSYSGTEFPTHFEDQFDGENPDENSPDFSSEFSPDPAPDELPRQSRKQPARRAAVEVPTTSRANKALAKKVGTELAGCIEMVAAMWEMTGDHCCAPVLEQQAPALGAAFAKILERYPSMLAKAAQSDLLSGVLTAGMVVTAVKPVATAVYQNHMINQKDDDGPDPLAEFPPYIPPVPASGVRG